MRPNSCSALLAPSSRYPQNRSPSKSLASASSVGGRDVKQSSNTGQSDSRNRARSAISQRIRRAPPRTPTYLLELPIFGTPATPPLPPPHRQTLPGGRTDTATIGALRPISIEWRQWSVNDGGIRSPAGRVMGDVWATGARGDHSGNTDDGSLSFRMLPVMRRMMSVAAIASARGNQQTVFVSVFPGGGGGMGSSQGHLFWRQVTAHPSPSFPHRYRRTSAPPLGARPPPEI